MKNKKCAAKTAVNMETANPAFAVRPAVPAEPPVAPEAAKAAQVAAAGETGGAAAMEKARPAKALPAERLAMMMEAADGVACKRCGKVFFHSSLWVRLCPECRDVCATERSHSIPRRVCHDCGKATANYRCDACWARFRAKHDVPQDVLDW